jgi:AbrB family looped-hinge helix DNA binding protein
MPSSTVTFNGRVTLPINVRKQLGLKTGDSVDFVEIDKDRFAIRHCSAAGADCDDSGAETHEAGEARKKPQ